MASKQDSTKVMWRLQYRGSRYQAWKNGGLYEVRSTARAVAALVRLDFGFGNTRVVRHVRGGGR